MILIFDHSFNILTIQTPSIQHKILNMRTNLIIYIFSLHSHMLFSSHYALRLDAPFLYTFIFKAKTVPPIPSCFVVFKIFQTLSHLQVKQNDDKTPGQQYRHSKLCNSSTENTSHVDLTQSWNCIDYRQNYSTQNLPVVSPFPFHLPITPRASLSRASLVPRLSPDCGRVSVNPV